MEIKRFLKRLIVLIALLLMISVFTSKVNAMTIVIDPGHGGNDPGALRGDVHEADLNLKIARYLRDYLNDYLDMNVLLTHEDSTMDLPDRADFARNNRADLLISVHVNNSVLPFSNGAEAYVTYRTELPKYNEQMTVLGNKILSNISSLGIANGGVRTRIAANDENEDEYKYYDGQNGDYYGIIRRSMKGGHETSLGPNFSDGSGISTILVEHAYMSNDHDYNLINSDDKLKALAKADADAIAEFYSLKKAPSKTDVGGYLFNAKFYADKYEDLRNSYGYNEELLRTHYYVFGIREGRTASPVFDPVYYLNKYNDLRIAFGNDYTALYNHFLSFGIDEGRASSVVFDSGYYLGKYSDLQNAFGNNNYRDGLIHFINFGMKEGRVGSTEFDAGYYLNLYPDLQKAFGNTNYYEALNHFLIFGINEGRSGILK